MKVGIGGNASSLRAIVAEGVRAEQAGFAAYSISNILGHDAIGAQTVVARETRRIELLTAVVPIPGRHPVGLAQQALTAQAAAGGRFTLGIGLSHKALVDRVFGLPYDPPGERMREYLEILMPLLRGESVKVAGRFCSARALVSAPDHVETRCLVGALGPRMLDLAGSLADGTVLWLAGSRAIREYVVPRVREAAAKAGRGVARVVCGLPIALSDVEMARQKANELWGGYSRLPSYARILEREGASTPGDVAVVGDERQIGAALERLRDAGVTTFLGTPFPADPGAVERTWSYLAATAERWAA